VNLVLAFSMNPYKFILLFLLQNNDSFTQHKALFLALKHFIILQWLVWH
jgi:hypothetical protein